MRLAVSSIFAIAAVLSGLCAAYLWQLATKIEPEPEGIEPFEPEMKQAWWNVANYIASKRSAKLNQKAAWLTAGAALFGFASFLASELLKPN